MSTTEFKTNIIQNLEESFQPLVTENIAKQIEDFIQGKNMQSNTNQKKGTARSYIPKESTFTKLSSASEELAGLLVGISPFIAYQQVAQGIIAIKPEPQKLLKKFLPFNEDQLRRMDESLKERIVQSSLLGFKKTMREYRDILLNEDRFMFKETYELQKLRILMKKDGEPPILFSEGDYQHMEEVFVHTLSKWLRYHIGLTGPVIYPSYIEKEVSEETRFVIEIHKNLLTKYPLERTYLRRLSNAVYYYITGGGNLSPQEIEEIKQWKSSAIVENIYIYNDTTPLSADSVITGQTETLMQHIDSIRSIMNLQDFQKIVEHFTSLAKIIQTSMEKGTLFKLDRRTLQIISNVMQFIPTLKEQINK